MIWSDLHAVLERRGLLSGTASSVEQATSASVKVSGIAYDSRKVQEGDVFVALRGQHADGAVFAAQAVSRGAVLVVSEGEGPADSGVPWIRVNDARAALAFLSLAFFHDPSRHMSVVGITGTNGKTTTAHLVASIFEAAGVPCGLLGTVAYRVGQRVSPAMRTTPEAPDVQALLSEMLAQGCGACAMEVSSHALSLKRVEGMTFAAAIFTNLTRDHLDFHADMESYFQAKRRLFQMLARDCPAVINADDPRAGALVETVGRAVTFGITRPADVSPTPPLLYSLEGLAFQVKTPRGTIGVRSPLVGRPNVYNILAAVAVGVALDLPLEAIEVGIASLDRVPGRFQLVSTAADDVSVVVDYAHTDDALKNLLETARPLTTGRIITVFGCGGDRDRTKRPLMGAVAGRLSDVIVITSDNPRGEDPARIIEEIQRGITPDTRRNTAQRTLAVIDRRQAIERAIEMASPGDIVLVAGKGHEQYQTIGAQTLPFDDVAVARDALSKRRAKQGVR